MPVGLIASGLLGRKSLRKLRKVGRIFGRKKRRRRRRAARQAALEAKTRTGLSSLNISSSDVDNGSFTTTKASLLGSGSSEEKTRNFILMVAGIGLAAIVLLILIFKK